MKYLRFVLRIYLSPGGMSYNDDILKKFVKNNFKKRSLLQSLFILLIVFTQFVLPKLDKDIVLPITTLIFLYLLLDITSLVKSVGFSPYKQGEHGYNDIKLFEKIGFTGILNLYLMILFSGYLLKNL